MTNRVVVACFGDSESTAAIHQMSVSAEVVAVAFDFGGRIPLAAIRDTALAAGAARCHALDVREEFARESVIPALQRRDVTDPVAAVDALAHAFVARKLQEIGRLEHAAIVAPEIVALSPRPVPRAAAESWRLQIGFEDGFPVSINGVQMTLTELMESIETITGEPALNVLDREMLRSREEQSA